MMIVLALESMAFTDRQRRGLSFVMFSGKLDAHTPLNNTNAKSFSTQLHFGNIPVLRSPNFAIS